MIRSTARRLRLLALLACAALCLPGAASAADESGVPLGPLIAKPSISVELVYDSNVYRQQQAPQADLGLQAIPRIGLVFPGESFRWELNAHYRFFTYFNVAGRNHDDLRDLANFGISTSFDLGRQAKVGFWIAPRFYNRRGARGADIQPEQGSDLAYELGVVLPLELRFRPTQAFQIGVDAHWQYTRAFHPIFDPNPTVLGQPHDVGGGVSLDWRFFPRSHFLIDADVGHVFQGPASPVRSDTPVENTYWRALVGMKGDITRKLSMMGLIGYGNVYLGQSLRAKNLSGIEGLIGQAEIALRPITTQRLALGFRRDFSFRYYAYHITDTQAYFKYKGLIASRLQIQADVTYIYRDLEGNDGGDDGIPRTEHQLSAGAQVDVFIADWFAVLAGYRFSMVNPSSTNQGEYIDNRVNIGLRLGFM